MADLCNWCHSPMAQGDKGTYCENQYCPSRLLDTIRDMQEEIRKLKKLYRNLEAI